jgi:hypothetical protein
LFLARGEDLDAAIVALEAIHLAGGPGSLGLRGEPTAVQALFLAADNPGIVPLLSDVNEKYSDWPDLMAIAARTALYLKHEDDANRWLSLALESRPGDPLARTVRAEQLYVQGETVQARAFAQQVLDQPRLPAWLADHLRTLIEKPPTPEP